MLEKTRAWIREKVKKGNTFYRTLYKVLERIYKLRLTCNPIFILKNRNLIPWVPNKMVIQVDITYRCSLACLNCDRSVRQAPSDECMSPKQVEKFVDESIKLNWDWRDIALMGGEPTLHPKFFKILKILDRYRKFNPKCTIVLSTNGFGSKVKEVLSKMPDWVHVVNSHKVTTVHKFTSYNLAPIDLEKYKKSDFSRGCNVTEICGLGLNMYGYYPCAAGASVDRVFVFDIGIKKLSEVNNSALRKQLKMLCKYCGHYKEDSPKDRISQEKISPSWQKAYGKYKKRKPELSLY